MTTGLAGTAKTENRCFVLDLHHMRQKGRACVLFNSAREVKVAQKMSYTRFVIRETG